MWNDDSEIPLIRKTAAGRFDVLTTPIKLGREKKEYINIFARSQKILECKHGLASKDKKWKVDIENLSPLKIIGDDLLDVVIVDLLSFTQTGV